MANHWREFSEVMRAWRMAREEKGEWFCNVPSNKKKENRKAIYYSRKGGAERNRIPCRGPTERL